MSRYSVPFTPAACMIIVLALAMAGCSTPLPSQDTGSVSVTSMPAGGDLYLDNEYRGRTPATVTAVPAGAHTVEVRLAGYEPWSAPVKVTRGSGASLAAVLVKIPATLPVTFATTAAIPQRNDLPQIHVDGYWTYPQGSTGTTNPVPLLVHTEAFNVGSADAREVTVAANFWYQNRMICWNTIYLGTLNAGGHVARDSMVSCTLPSPIDSQDLEVRFENLVVTP